MDVHPTSGADTDGGRRSAPRRTRPLVGVLVVIAGVPFVVALVAMRDPRWYPSLDYAMTELRVRDVATPHPPMVGLAGRIHGFGQQGSHPGPVSFWVLWPAYRLLGGSGWALLGSTAALHLVALGAALWIAARRGGRGVLLGVAAALSLLMLGYGIDRLTEPWNPYLPVIWWVVFLLAVWSVLCDDLVMLPAAMFAGSFCAQTHVSYIGLVAGLLGCAAVVLGVRARRADAGWRRALLRWGLASVAVLAVMWSPPVIEDLRHQPGNLTILRANFTEPGEDPVGLGGRAVQVWLADLDVSRVPQHDSSFDEAPQGSALSGLVVMGAWLAAAAVTWPRRQAVPVLWRLHVVAALALLLGLLSVSRIFGPLSSYLLLWARGTTVVVLVATVWSGASAWSAGVLGRFPPRWGPVGGAAVLLAVVLGSTAGLTRTAVGAPVPSPDDSRVLAHLVPDTVDALRAGRARGTGPDGRYFVQWSDASAVAPEGYGLLLELERAGMEVSGQTGLAVNLVPHRARGAAGATATVTFVRGDDDIERWRADPDRVEVARYDPRTDGERARYRELRAEVDAELRRAGLDDVADLVRENLFVAMLSERFPPDLRPEVEEMVRLGQAAAVFVGPPTLDVPLFG